MQNGHKRDQVLVVLDAETNDWKTEGATICRNLKGVSSYENEMH